MATLDIPAGHINYEVVGRGFPVLLYAPGFLSSRMERWRTNPAKPGVPQDWLDPMAKLADDFQLIALDVRNAGQSRAAVTERDDWGSYTADSLALLQHLGVTRCHVMGACIGVSFALALAAASPGLVTSLVLQNPIGLSPENRAALDHEFDSWTKEVRDWANIDPKALSAFGKRMFGGDFIYSVSREFVLNCTLPMLLMPGDDLVHPAVISDELARAPNVEIVKPWKGLAHRGEAMRRVREFLLQYTP